MTKRSPQHVTDSRGSGQLTIDLSPYTLNPLDANDYGLDYVAVLTEDTEDPDSDQKKVTGDHFYIQLKSSSGFDSDDSVHYDLKTTHIEQYLGEPLPVILAIYDDEYGEIYWRVIQDFVWDELNHGTPNWRDQNTARVRISREQKITQYDRLEAALKRTKSRITRRQSQTMNIGEGIQFTPDVFTELQQQIDSERRSYRGHVLLAARQHLKRGRFDEAEAAISEVTDLDHDDEAKVKGLFMSMLMLKSTNADEALEMAELADEAEITARDLGLETDSLIANVYKHVGGLFVILKRRKEMVATDVVQDTSGELEEYSALRSPIEVEVLRDELYAVTRLNNALASLLENEDYYAYATCLSPVIDYLMQRTSLEIHSPRTDDGIREEPHPIVDQAEQLADFMDDPETEFNLRKSSGVYRYFAMADADGAIQRLTEALELAKEIDDNVLIKDIERLIAEVSDRPNPYDRDTQESDMSLEESTKMILEMQGIDTEADRDGVDGVFDSAVQRGIEDADPERYHRHCENIRIGYSPSMLGEMTGVTSIGTKYMWCQHGGGMMGAGLSRMFDSFKQNFCEGCEHHCPRPDDWEFTDEYADEQVQDPDFQTFLSTQREWLK